MSVPYPLGLDSPNTGRLPLAPSQPYKIQSEAEALVIAKRLATSFRETAAERDRKRLLPWDEIETYTASGLGSITIPKDYGGLGASYKTLAQMFVILCTADPSLGQIPQNHFALIQNLKDLGSNEQKQRWFADVLAGHRLGNAGPELKSKTAHINDTQVSLVKTDEGLRLSGTRFYSTGSIFAHWIPLRAKNEQGQLVQVWVKYDSPGVRVIDDWSAFGQKTTASGSVIFDQVAVEASDLVEVWRFTKHPTLSGPVSQLIQASIDMGIAQAALQDTLAFVHARSRPWLDSGVAQASLDPYIIFDIGALQVEVDAAYAVLLETAQLLDDLAQATITETISAQASVAVAEAKILTTEAALNSSEKLFELAGSAATRASHNLDRHWRNARVHTLHDPVRWKYHLLGNYLLNGALPKRHQWN